MKAPKCKICGKEHYGMCPSEAIAGAIVDALLPKPGKAKPKAKPALHLVPEAPAPGSPATKMAEARRILDELNAKNKLPASSAIAEAELVDTTNTPRGSGKARKAPGRKPRPRKEAIGTLKQGAKPALDTIPHPSPATAGGQEGAAGAGKPETSEAPAASKPRKANRHRPGYMAEYMRKRRAAKKEGKP